MVASSNLLSTSIEVPHRETQMKNNNNKKKSDRSDSPAHRPSSSQKNESQIVSISNAGENEPKQGKTCHQCRQRTTKVMSSCKNHRNGKPCPIKICQKCLLNRYGEKVEEVALISEWRCPKCRGICNCSFCMKKKGHQPTGMLAPMAKATGFSSVSEMLLIKGPEGVNAVKVPERLSASSMEVASLMRKRGKENSFDGKCNPNLQTKSLMSSPGLKNVGDTGQKCTKGNESNNNATGEGKTNGNEPNKSFKKSRISEEITEKAIKKGKKIDHNGNMLVKDSSNKSQIHREMSLNFVQKDKNLCAKNENDPSVENASQNQVSGVLSQKCVKKEMKIVQRDSLLLGEEVRAPLSGNSGDEKAEPKARTEFREIEKYRRIHQTYCDADIELPQGTELTNVAGIDLPAEDAGHALQFLEFCKAFGQVFSLKKGQPELILRELVQQRSRRRGQYSPIVHFHIQLLSLLQEDSGEKSLSLSATSNGNSWLQALGDWISDSHRAFEDLPSNCFDRGSDGYERLSISQKLRILNFLCDEALSTADLRTWIDKQDLKFVRRTKEAKDKVLAAKDKEKQVKQQLQDEMARAAVLSISEYDDVMSKMKNEAAKVRAEILEAIELLPKKKQRSDAVRTVPIFLDAHGHIFWRLRGSLGESSILLQDIGSWDSVTPKEKWFTYDMEQNKVVENYISSLSEKMHRMRKVPEKLAFGTCEASSKHETLDDPSSPSSVVEGS